MAKRILGAAALAIAMACDSGGSDTGHVCKDANTTPDPALLDDYSVNFTGDWYLALTITAGGYSSGDAGVATISRVDVNELAVPSCVERNPALVKDAASFDTVCYVCPVLDVPGCSTVIVTLASGEGVLDELTGELSLDYLGTMNVCGEVYDLTMTLQGSRWEAAASPDPPRAGPSIDAALGRLGSSLVR